MNIKKKTTLIFGVAIITIIVIFIIAFIVSKILISPYKQQVVKKDNFMEIMNKAEEELKEDERYYLSYIVLKNLTSADELYGNTVNELIKKGKAEMKKDGYTIEKFKKELSEFNNNTNNALSEFNQSGEVKKQDELSKLMEINNEFVVGIWNDLFCDVDHYLEGGKDSIGQEFDYDRAMKKADKIMLKENEYNEFINGLDDEYSEIKDLWNKLLPEAKKLYNKVKQEKPKAMDKNYDYNVEIYREYMYDFGDLVYDIN